MPLLFSYGTLQEASVQLLTFGRLLRGEPDELVGFEQSPLEIADPQVVAGDGKNSRVTVKRNGRADCRVSGTLFEISEAELENADKYEPADYTRVSATLASGKEAWVYAATRS
jgi:gamma-glutamylcyclotransferase (GGCT)/AIG2-like uncharacterized protein YtfP